MNKPSYDMLNKDRFGIEFLSTNKLFDRSKVYAVSGLIPFIETCFNCQGKEYKSQPHHETIANKLEQCLVGKCNRLIINVFPRSGKTTLLEYFIAYSLGLYPNSNNIWTSYSQSLSTESSSRIREIINSDYYKQIFPSCKMSKDTDSKTRFTTINSDNQRGDFVSVGAGGSITGKGAGTMGNSYGGAIIVDDPIKPADANSDVSREEINRWFFETLYSRRNSPNTPIIIIMQRLHENDLTGFVMGLKGDNWTNVNIPVIDNDGKSIWDDQFPLAQLEIIKQSSPAVFKTQFMQNPIPTEGILFKKENIRFYDKIPAETSTRTYITTDFAVTLDKGDYTVFTVVEIDSKQNIYVKEVYRKKTTPDVWSKKLVSMVQEHNPVEILVESGVIFNSVENSIKTHMNNETAFATITKTTRTKDKETSAQTFLGLFNMEKLHLRNHDPMNGDIINELISFPKGKHDDIVDTLALLGLNFKRIIDSNVSPEDDFVVESYYPFC